MQAYKITIEPVSPGTLGKNTLTAGTGAYAKVPAGPVRTVIQATAAQIVGLQGYLTCINAGTVTDDVETVVTSIVT